MRGKQVRRIAHLEVRIFFAVDGEVREDADARPSRTYFLITSESRAVSATFGVTPASANDSRSEAGPEKLNE